MADANNPYAAPSAPVADVAQAGRDGHLIEGGRAVPSGNGWLWIAQGFDLFKMNPGIWILNSIILFVLLVAVQLIPFLGFIGLYVLLPVFVGGLMLGCEALRRNEPFEVGHLFAGFRDKFGPLAVLGLLYLAGIIVIFLLIMVFAGVGVMAMFTGNNLNMSMTMLLLVALIAIGLSIPLLMAIWFAPALVVLHDVRPLDAMKQSFAACMKNLVPFLVYGIIGLVISILATIPALLGWLVWVPTLYASAYTAYRDIFVEPG